MINAFLEYKVDLKFFIESYQAIRLSDAFVNIVNSKIDEETLKRYKLNILLKKVIKIYPDKYIKDLFLVRLVTLLEEYLKNRLIEEFSKNEVTVKNFLLSFNSDRKLTAQDVINGPKLLAIGYLDEILFHNMPKVERVYNSAFKFDIKKLCDFKRIVVITKMRHLIVHNGGKTKTNEKIQTHSLQTCIDEINKLIENIEFYIKNGRPKKSIKKVYIDAFGKDLMQDNLQDLVDYEIVRVFGESE